MPLPINPSISTDRLQFMPLERSGNQNTHDLIWLRETRILECASFSHQMSRPCLLIDVGYDSFILNLKQVFQSVGEFEKLWTYFCWSGPHDRVNPKPLIEGPDLNGVVTD